MRRSHLASLGLSVLFACPLVAQGATPAAKPAVPKIQWESDFDAALQRAKTENKPLFVAFLMDKEPANDETIYKLYTDPDILKLTAKFVCLACCVGTHELDHDTCSKFPGCTCEQHQAIEKKARARWIVGEDVLAPQHVFCDPDGQVLLRKVYFVPKETLQSSMAVALAAVSKDPEAAALVAAERSRVDVWLKDTGSRNLEVKTAALRELAASEDPRALPAVLRAAKTGDDPGRVAAIGALAKKGNFGAVEPLAAMLSDGKTQVVLAAARALETIQMPQAGPAVLAALKKERRDRVRGALLRAVARSTPSSAAARDVCLQALKGASTQLESNILLALGRMHANSQIIEAVKPRLQDKNQNTRGLAVWVLGAQGTQECAALIQGLLQVERTPEVTSIANKALKRIRGEKVENYEDAYGTFFWDSDY
jgi:HEAT repeat protein